MIKEFCLLVVLFFFLTRRKDSLFTNENDPVDRKTLIMQESGCGAAVRMQM